jgi:hypothetical protein
MPSLQGQKRTIRGVQLTTGPGYTVFREEELFFHFLLKSERGVRMTSVAKIIELSADSEKNFEDALTVGIKRANDTIRNVRSVWIKDKEVLIEKGVPKIYRLHLKVTFCLD